jgi:hypothetical protein
MNPRRLEAYKKNAKGGTIKCRPVLCCTKELGSKFGSRKFQCFVDRCLSSQARAFSGCPRGSPAGSSPPGIIFPPAPTREFHRPSLALRVRCVLAIDGDDLRDLSLSMRKASLARLLARRPDGIFVSDFEQVEIGPR